MAPRSGVPLLRLENRADAAFFDQQHPAVGDERRDNVVGVFGFVLPEQMRFGDVPFAAAAHRQNHLLGRILADDGEIDARKVVGMQEREVQLAPFQETVLD